MSPLGRLLFISLVSIVWLGAPCTRAASQESQLKGQIANFLKSKFNVKFHPTTAQDALDDAFNSLGLVEDADTVLTVHEETVSALITAELSKRKQNFTAAKIEFGEQTASIEIRYDGPLQAKSIDIDLKAALSGRLAIAISFDPEHPNEVKLALSIEDMHVYITESNVTFLGVGVSSATANSVAEASIQALLNTVKEIVDRIEIRVPTLLSTTIEMKQDKSSRTDISFTISPPSLPLSIRFGLVALILDQDRMFVVTKNSTSVTSPQKNVELPLLRRRLQDILAKTLGLGTLRKLSFVYISDSFLGSAVNNTFKGKPICASVSVGSKPLPFNVTIPGPNSEAIRCEQNRGCEQATECRPSISCNRKEDKRKCKGNLVAKGWCEGSKGGQNVGYGVAKLSCETRKSTVKGLCEASKSADKGLCEAGKSLDKGGCEALKEAVKRIQHLGNVAQVKSDDFAIAGDGKFCISAIKFDAARLALSATTVAEASAHANGNVRFTPLDAGHLLCFAPWEKEIAENANVPRQTRQVELQAAVIDNTSVLRLNVAVDGELRIEAPVKSLISQIVDDPHFMMKCPLLGVAGQVFKITPNQWLPRPARGIFDVSVPRIAINSNIISRPTGGSVSSIRLRRANGGTVAAFNVIPAK
ncbi:hypothetical protein [Mesorhizobium sp. 128a]